jgi:TonB family protein
MVLRALGVAALLLSAPPTSAQTAQSQAAANAANWDIFLKLYPKRALEAREEGAVGFVVTLDSRGDVTDCKVTHSSGHPLLDQETCKLVTMNAVFRPDPNLGPSQTKTHEGMIAWKLPDSTTPLTPPTAIAASSQAAEKVICKKSIATGTLASVERTCLTQREWNRQSDNAKEMWEDIQGKKGSTHGN